MVYLPKKHYIIQLVIVLVMVEVVLNHLIKGLKTYRFSRIPYHQKLFLLMILVLFHKVLTLF